MRKLVSLNLQNGSDSLESSSFAQSNSVDESDQIVRLPVTSDADTATTASTFTSIFVTEDESLSALEVEADICIFHVDQLLRLPVMCASSDKVQLLLSQQLLLLQNFRKAKNLKISRGDSLGLESQYKLWSKIMTKLQDLNKFIADKEREDCGSLHIYKMGI